MNPEQILVELKFKAIRSSGAGGQHVNKVSSKMELTFDIEKSTGLSDQEKERLSSKLATRISKENLLILQCGEARSQHRNKELVVKRFFEIVKKALHVPKKRKRIKPSKAAVERRLKSKKLLSEKKAGRSKPNFD